jgi:uncharacterized protein DUF4349
MRLKLEVLAVAISILLPACERAASPTATHAEASASASAASALGSSALSLAGAPPAQASAGAARSAVRERKLVRSAELRLEVSSYAAARARLDEALALAGGYVAEARVEHADGAVATASLELRLPAAELDGFVQRIAGLGSVLLEQIHSSEITDEYIDAAARLANQRRLEGRLVEFASARTSDVKELLEVERELARVREDIEALEARIARYDSRVALSSVSLDITSRERVHVGAEMGLGERVLQALGDSCRAWRGRHGEG